MPASAPVSAATPTPLSGTTEKNFSVDKYFKIQEKKRAGAAKTASPKTVFDGSSVLSTDGGIPVDYEEGELEGTSSSQPSDSKSAAGTRRAREDESDASSWKRQRSVRDAVPSTLEEPAIVSDAPAITPDPSVVSSEQRDAPRTDDSVRDPWMPSESVISAWYGRTVPPNVIPLYVDSRIIDDAEAESKSFDLVTNQRRDYYISLFHELRYWSSKKTSGRSRVPEWQARCQSWNPCVENFTKDSTAYHDRVASARERFMKTPLLLSSIAFTKVRACAVDVSCSHCPPGAPHISERDTTGYTTHRVPAIVKELRAKLACTRQHPIVVPDVTPPVHLWASYSLTISEHPSSGRYGEATYLEGEPIVSNEYANEPDLGSSSDCYGQQSDPPRGGSYRGQSYVSVGGGRRPSYGQPQVDHSLQPLHARVEALENLQAAQIVDLTLQLKLQRLTCRSRSDHLKHSC
ncbi:hypothetical protein PHMEG_00023840 [Phytophthora megakarya]|uniref:Uncharacterized protein n=1 Tax=Phytophthora megakarya TaxID=4795 RepID=A0A225VG45_9STRA|nr:hypothetical protein PHMEG_00023840 [Phytophthora megakarya]